MQVLATTPSTIYSHGTVHCMVSTVYRELDELAGLRELIDPAHSSISLYNGGYHTVYSTIRVDVLRCR